MTNRGYFAHTSSGRTDTWEPLEQHLTEVGELAADFADEINAASWGRIAGRYHDIGKFSNAFQGYLCAAADVHSPDVTGKVDHSTAGAQLSMRFGPFGQLMAYVIAGHHAGLPNWFDGLENRLSKMVAPWQENAADWLQDEVLPKPEFQALPTDRVSAAFKVAFFTRMVFSCLVDADFLCTERFMSPRQAAVRAPITLDLSTLQVRLTQHVDKLSVGAAGVVNAIRRDVLQRCREASSQAVGTFSLCVPTGGGKTLSSMEFALRHAIRNRQRRVIVAMPFTSIVEQNASVYRKAFGDTPEGTVIEHHCNLEPANESTRNRLSAENWDAPIVVTTNVQLLESLFAARTSRCRKLHNIANSVIILDEAQCLPVDLLQATLLGLQELVDEHGCSIVLCSATQPAIEHSDSFPIGMRDVIPILADGESHHETLKRVRIDQAGLLTDNELGLRLRDTEQILCVVNTRAHAAELYQAIHQEPGAFHLSTRMCAQHRFKTLTEIRQRLCAGESCRVVSTQLIEAGVDVDFPVVLRAACGLDSLVQATGRCNREGKLKAGTVVWFDTEKSPPPGHLRRTAEVAKEIVCDDEDLLAPNTIRRYFAHYYWTQQHQWDAHEVLGRDCLPANVSNMKFGFKTMAQRYRLIRDAGVPVIVPYGTDGEKLRDRLLEDFPPDRPTWRRLQRFTVSVYEAQAAALVEAGDAILTPQGVIALLRASRYNQQVGIDLTGLGVAQASIDELII